MWRLAPFLLVLPLVLTGCFETDGPTLDAGVRAEQVPDGVWRRADGREVRLSWDGAHGAYALDSGGLVRLVPLGAMWLVDYQAERSVLMLAEIGPDGVSLLQPRPEVARRLALADGVKVRPGPLERLDGDAAARRRFMDHLSRLAGSGDLVVTEHLTRVGPS